ncbi:MAG: YihY/virulence factor BrkB family protein [Candidatus Binatia bacterium]
MRLRETGSFLREVIDDWQRDNALSQGAALAYYTLFSLTPLLVLVIIVAGLALGRAAAQGQVVDQIQGLVGPDTAGMVQGMVERASTPRSGIVPTLVSVAAILFGASGLVGQLRTSLNQIWGVPPTKGGGVLAALRQRLLALVVIGGMGMLLLLSAVLSTVLAAAQELIAHHLPLVARVLPASNLVLSLVVSTTFFAMIFELLPDVDMHWRDVWLGAGVTAILFTVGKGLIALYLGRAASASIYGAAGSLVLLLLWVYYSAQILLLGAEFTEVYARRYGSLRGRR